MLHVCCNGLSALHTRDTQGRAACLTGCCSCPRQLAPAGAPHPLQATDATLRELTTLTGGDMRLVLGHLQMIRVRSRALSWDEVKVHWCCPCLKHLL
jgi:hypothetical protein